LICLVDFDNIDAAIRGAGLKYVVERILAAVCRSKPVTRTSVRLYGGWYDQTRPTRLAQRLAASSQADFPANLSIPSGAGFQAVTTSVELAYALIADPHHHLLHTFRSREFPSTIKCRRPQDVGCRASGCPAAILYHFISTLRCPDATCSFSTSDFLYRGEQKLVDTMIAVDLIHAVNSGEQEICVVTSDDDLWPAIIQALRMGATVHHVHAKPGRNTAAHYSRGLGPTYCQTVI
jgi:uncharacterized LabA/DUF88 family protein